MKKVWLSLLLFNLIVVSEDIVLKVKPKKESTQKIKEQLAQDFQEVLTLSTHSIKYLTELIDDIVVHVKQLAGQEQGELATADKKTLQLYQQKACQVKKLLQNLDGQCSISIKL